MERVNEKDSEDLRMLIQRGTMKPVPKQSRDNGAKGKQDSWLHEKSKICTILYLLNLIGLQAP